MDFAANAVIEAVAPTRQPARAPTDRSTPSFEDHLDAVEDSPATQDGAPRTDANAERSIDDNVEAEADAEAPMDATPMVAQPAPQPVAPILLQLIDLAGGPITPPTQPAASDGVNAPPAPAGAQAATAPVSPPTAAAPPTRDVDGAPQTEQSADAQSVQQPVKQEAAKADAAPNAPLPPTPAQPAQQQAPTQIAAQQAPAQPAPSSTPPAQTAAPPIPAPAAVTASAPVSTKAPVVESGKTDAPRGNSKADAAAAKAVEQAPPQKSQAGAPNISATVTEGAIQAASMADNGSAQSQAHLHATASTAAAHTQHAVLDQSAARAAPAASQVAREIVRRFDGETTRFELRLDPPELGRVEVRLEVSRDHRVTAVVAADSPQALTELARHARELEQALQSAGLQLTDNGLSFDLRQSRDEGGDGERSGGSAGADNDEQLTETPAAARPIGLERWRGVRVDVMI